MKEDYSTLPIYFRYSNIFSKNFSTRTQYTQVFAHPIMAGCGHSSCQHNHSHDEDERGLQYSLYQKIDFTHLEVLNEAEEGSGKSVFRPWNERLDRKKVQYLSPLRHIILCSC